MSEDTFLQNWALSDADTFQKLLQPSMQSTTSHPNIPLWALCKADQMVWILSSVYQNKNMWSLSLTAILIPSSNYWRYWHHSAWQAPLPNKPFLNCTSNISITNGSLMCLCITLCSWLSHCSLCICMSGMPTWRSWKVQGQQPRISEQP